MHYFLFSPGIRSFIWVMGRGRVEAENDPDDDSRQKVRQCLRFVNYIRDVGDSAEFEIGTFLKIL